MLLLVCLSLLIIQSNGYISKFNSNKLIYTNKFNKIRKVNEIVCLSNNQNINNNIDSNINEDNDSEPALGDLGNYSLKQILKEETEAPFRKIRLFVYFSLLIASSIGSLFSITSFLTADSKGIIDKSELTNNLLINVLSVPVLLLFIRKELINQRVLLDRIQRGGRLSGLKIQYSGSIVKLIDLRRNRGIEKRVVIVAAPNELLQSSTLSAYNQRKSLVANDLIIIPLVIKTNGNSYDLSIPSIESLLNNSENIELSPDDLKFIGLPIGLSNWNDVIKGELGNAIKQQPEALNKGITLIIKKNGKVGTRRFGVPIWEILVEDVEDRKQLGLDVTNL